MSLFSHEYALHQQDSEVHLPKFDELEGEECVWKNPIILGSDLDIPGFPNNARQTQSFFPQGNEAQKLKLMPRKSVDGIEQHFFSRRTY